MRYLVLACRSLFKKGQHNVLKIVSLAVGLAVGLLLLAKVFFLRSYDTFYPGCENIYRVRMDYSVGEENGESFTTSGAVAPGMAAEIPGVETYARLVGYYPEYGTVMDLKGNRYSVEEVGMVDTTWFDLFKTPVLAGDPGKIFSNPLGAMVSRKMAERMGGISQVIGKQLYVEEYPMHRFTVEGVFEDLPENSSLSQEILISIHTPLLFQRLLSNWNGGERFQSFVRLSPGVDPSSLSPALDEMIDRHVGFENLEQEGLMMHYSLWPLTDYVMMQDQVRVMFRMLLLMAVVLLLVSVLNYGLISVSGILNQTREIAVRKCYGAGNKDILRLSLAETALHTSIALILAVLIVLSCGNIVEEMLDVPVTALLFSRGGLSLLLVCVLLVLVSAFLPARFMGKVPVASAFRNLSSRRRSWKTGLLVFQFAASAFVLCLLLGVSRQYGAMVNNDPGYDYDNLVYLNVSAVDTSFRTSLAQELERLPEVRGVTLSTSLFFEGASGNNVFMPGSTEILFNVCDLYFAGDAYFDVTGLEIVEGKAFREGVRYSDEVMVSKSFAEKIKPLVDWPGGVIGHRIGVTEHSGMGSYFEICGVYEDLRVGVIGSEDDRPSVLFYGRDPRLFNYMLVAFHHRDAEAMAKVGEVVERLLPGGNVRLYSFRDEIVESYRDVVQFRNQVLVGGIVCLLITLLGLLGYLNDELARRRKEIAVRRVHGASQGGVLGLFWKDTLRTSLPAVLVGALAAYFVLERWLQQFSVKAGMPWWMFAAGILVVCVLAYGCLVVQVARFASRNPVEGLRSE